MAAGRNEGCADEEPDVWSLGHNLNVVEKEQRFLQGAYRDDYPFKGACEKPLKQKKKERRCRE